MHEIGKNTSDPTQTQTKYNVYKKQVVKKFGPDLAKAMQDALYEDLEWDKSYEVDRSKCFDLSSLENKQISQLIRDSMCLTYISGSPRTSKLTKLIFLVRIPVACPRRC